MASRCCTIAWFALLFQAGCMDMDQSLHVTQTEETVEFDEETGKMVHSGPGLCIPLCDKPSGGRDITAADLEDLSRR